MSSNLPTLKVVHGYNSLVTLICYVLELLEQLLIMLPSESTDFDFSLTWNFHVHATIIQLSQEDIFFTIVKDSMGIGTLEETR